MTGSHNGTPNKRAAALPGSGSFLLCVYAGLCSAAQHLMGGLYDGGSIQTVGMQQVPGRAGAAKLILHADAAHGGGSFSLSRAQTASPRPPMTLCSSAVMTLPHSAAAFSTSSSSRGLMVCRLMTRAWMPSAASCSAAMRASLTIRPVARMAMSLPSVSCSPLPISK